MVAAPYGDVTSTPAQNITLRVVFGLTILLFLVIFAVIVRTIVCFLIPLRESRKLVLFFYSVALSQSIL